MNFERTVSIFLCVIALLFLLGFTAHCISQNIDRADKVYNQVATDVYKTGWADEFMIRNQQLYKNNPALEQADNKRAMDALTNLILSFSKAGQLISKPTFCKILKLDMQNDDILNADGTININKLMTSGNYWSTKRDITKAIWQDQANYHTVISGIGTLLGDDRVNKYSRSDCPELPLPKFSK